MASSFSQSYVLHTNNRTNAHSKKASSSTLMRQYRYTTPTFFDSIRPRMHSMANIIASVSIWFLSLPVGYLLDSATSAAGMGSAVSIIHFADPHHLLYILQHLDAK